MFEIRRVIDPVHETKKQILSELMERNKIPVSYFLMGKLHTNIELDVGTVANLVDISSNKDGDIIIKPIEEVSKKVRGLTMNNIIRDQVLGKVVETQKKARVIGKSLEAKVRTCAELNSKPISKAERKRELVKHSSAKTKESIKVKLDDLIHKDIEVLSVQKVIPIKEEKKVIESFNHTEPQQKTKEHIKLEDKPIRKVITRTISPLKRSCSIKQKARTQCDIKAISSKKRTNKRNIQLSINKSEEFNRPVSPKVKDKV
jgi:hypothetical protein